MTQGYGEFYMEKKQGFTLVELLVVISIIALLLAVLMPSLNKARAQAQKIVCCNNMKTVLLAADIYALENRECYVPIVGGPDMTWHINGITGTNPTWYHNDSFRKTVDLKSMKNSNDIKTQSASETLPDKFKCPADKRTVENGGLYKSGNYVMGVSIAMNRMGLLKSTDTGWDYRIPGGYSYKRTAVLSPGRKIFFADGMDYTLWDACANYKLYWDQSGDKFYLKNGQTAWDCISYRHSQGTDIGFFDGHVQWLKKQDVWDISGTTAQQPVKNAKLWLPLGKRYADDTTLLCR